MCTVSDVGEAGEASRFGRGNRSAAYGGLEQGVEAWSRDTRVLCLAQQDVPSRFSFVFGGFFFGGSGREGPLKSSAKKKGYPV